MMRSWLLLAGLALDLACTGPSAPPRHPPARDQQRISASATVEVRRDPTTGATVVRIKPPDARLPGSRPRLVAGVTVERPGRTPQLALLGFRATAQTWRYADCHQMVLVVDGGAATETIATQREAQIGGGHLSELLFGMVPLALIDRLSHASRVTVQLCRDRFALDASDLARLRRLMQRLQAAIASDR